MSAFSQNNQLKIILMPKRHILGWHILLPFNILLPLIEKEEQNEEQNVFS